VCECGPAPHYQIDPVTGVCQPSCGVRGGDCCPDGASCAAGSVGPTWDCHPCCVQVDGGSSCI